LEAINGNTQILKKIIIPKPRVSTLGLGMIVFGTL